MENTKIMTFAAAAIMMVAGFAIFGVSDDSDAVLGGNFTCGNNCNCDLMSMNYYIYLGDTPLFVDQDQAMVVLEGEGSNGFLALVDAVYNYDSSAVVGIDNPTCLDTSIGYYMMNTQYGNVTSMFGLSNDATNGYSWVAYYYNGTSWAACTMGLGYYKSINDIDSAYQTHNIALVYTNGTLPVFPTIAASDNVVSTVSSCVEYDVSFYITGDGVTSQWINGSGSDCLTAFIDAINDYNLADSANDRINTTYTSQYYGYVDTFLGQAERYDEDLDVYTSWSLFVWDGTQWVSAWFTMGHYTPGSDTYVDANSVFSMQTQYVMLSFGAWTPVPPTPSTPFPAHTCA